MELHVVLDSARRPSASSTQAATIRASSDEFGVVLEDGDPFHVEITP
ncbi:hypothetical protein AB0469_40290 [Streptomyces sp. NPDC093801]